MNKCSISEEVTTGALRALYQAPPPENHAANVPNISLAFFTDPQHIHQNHEPGLDMPSSYGKKDIQKKMHLMFLSFQDIFHTLLRKATWLL